MRKKHNANAKANSYVEKMKWPVVLRFWNLGKWILFRIRKLTIQRVKTKKQTNKQKQINKAYTFLDCVCR